MHLGPRLMLARPLQRDAGRLLRFFLVDREVQKGLLGLSYIVDGPLAFGGMRRTSCQSMQFLKDGTTCCIELRHTLAKFGQDGL